MWESLCIGDAGRCHPSLSPFLLQCAITAQARPLSACREWGCKEREQAKANTSLLPLKVQILVLGGPTRLWSVTGSRGWTICYPQLREERQERAPLVCTWQQRADGEGESCLPLSPPSNQSGWNTLLKPKPYSPLRFSRMQGTVWDGFFSSVAAKETPWTSCVFVCILQINYAWTSEHDYSF